MEFEGAATLRCWSIDVDLGGRTYTIPPVAADAWLLAIAEGTWADLVPGMLEDAGEVDDAIVDGLLDGDELRTAAHQALEAAAGCKWWIARTLAGVAMTSWVGGELQLKRIDPTRISLAAYLSAAYRATTVNMTKEQRGEFDMKLEQPPTGVAPEEWYDPAQAEANFLALMASGG